MVKNKTVKELNAEIELLVEKVKKLEDTSKIINDLQIEVENLEKLGKNPWGKNKWSGKANNL